MGFGPGLHSPANHSSAGSPACHLPSRLFAVRIIHSSFFGRGSAPNASGTPRKLFSNASGVISPANGFTASHSENALAVVASNEPVFREKPEPGAVLLRLAPSHIRFGTFEYFYFSKRYAELKELAELESRGDTAYVGAVPINDHQTLVSWYSSYLNEDPDWLTGIFAPSHIWLAWLDFSKL